MGQQLILNLNLFEEVSLNNYYAGKNKNVAYVLKKMVALTGDKFVFLWGAHGLGRSYLLQACAATVNKNGFKALYIPLSNIKNLTTDILCNLENMDLVCLDDLENISEDIVWQRAIFNLYNNMIDNNKYLLVSAIKSANFLNLALPDLTSRLNSGVALQIQAFSEEEKIEALLERAKARELNLPLEVINFLLKNSKRDNKTLFETLDKLDRAALHAQRRLTIPFIKKILQL